MNRLERSESATQMNEILLSLVAPLVGMARTVAWWRQVALQRRSLLGMDQRLLADIGLSRGQALHEANRPFWDVPPKECVSEPVPTRRDRGVPRPRMAGRAPRWA